MNFTEQITAVLSPAEIARNYLGEPDRHKRSPNSVWYCCPFHNEKTASLQVFNEAGKGFYCRGCNTGGTVVRFVERYFNLSNLEACRKLDEDFGLNIIDRHRKESPKQKLEREKKRNAVETAKVYLKAQHRFLQLLQAVWWQCDTLPTDYWRLCGIVYDSRVFLSVEQVRDYDKLCRAICGEVYAKLLRTELIIAGLVKMTEAEQDEIILKAVKICRI